MKDALKSLFVLLFAAPTLSLLYFAFADGFNGEFLFLGIVAAVFFVFMVIEFIDRLKK